MGKTRNTGFSNNAIQYNSGSIAFTSGSTTLFNINATGSVRYGVVSSNTHTITGSMYVTGAFYVATGSVGIGTVSPSQLFEVVGGEIKAGRVDTSQEGGQVSFGRSTDNNTAWYIDAYGNVASPQLRFVNVTNSVVAMTITGSNVGIGTSTPDEKLHVASGILRVTSTSTGINIHPNADFGAGGLPTIQVYTNHALQFATNNLLRMVIVNSGYIGIGTYSPSSKVTIIRDSPFNTGDQGLRIKANDGDGYNLWMGASSNGYATIQSYQDNVGGKPLLLNPLNGGNVLIGGITSTSAYLDGQISVSVPSGTAPAACFKNLESAQFVSSFWNAATTGDNIFVRFVSDSGASIRGTIFYSRTNGVARFDGQASGTYSDERLKDIKGEMTYGLDTINKIKTYDFNWKRNGNKGFGVKAQEISELIPEIVEKGSDGEIDPMEFQTNDIWKINYNELVPVLVKAIQELKAENDALKTRIETLENK
jgi:hypothetical protein